MASWGQTSFQDSATPTMRIILTFHDQILGLIIIIIVIVGYAIYAVCTNKLTSRFILDAQLLETLWTAIPITTLIFLAIPSLRLLYAIDEVISPVSIVNVNGHQWHWSYEYSAYESSDPPLFDFFSYINPEQNLSLGEYRLLETDNRIVLPLNATVRLIFSSIDVIHSWALPAFGINIDAMPGRINQAAVRVCRAGVFYGQCSEICGSNHSFIPITVEAISWEAYLNWAQELTLRAINQNED